MWGVGGPLQDWIIQLFSGGKAQQAEQTLQSQVASQGDTLLTSKLGNVSVFDATSTVQMLGQPVAMHLCASDLVRVGSSLVAHVAASASGARRPRGRPPRPARRRSTARRSRPRPASSCSTRT